MFPKSWIGWIRPERRSVLAKQGRAACRLCVEKLENRWCPSGGYLLVGDYDTNSVLRYNADTGAFVDTFVTKHSGGLNQPQGLVFGPHDRNLYVASGELSPSDQHKAVTRYNGTTGASLGDFAGDGHLVAPHAVIFGPDGNLYVADGFGTNSQVVRFDGITGAFLGNFVPPNSPGQLAPMALVFGPSTRPGKLDLYVTSAGADSVLRYDGTTGAPLGEFIASGSGGLDNPIGMTFGPDGNVYVISAGTGNGAHSSVMRFQGPSGRTPGLSLPSAGHSGAVFVPADAGGLLGSFGVIFGPDGNGDQHQDLYVPSFEWAGWNRSKQKTATIKRYDGVTGAFIDTFVTANSGGLDQPNYLTFTETDPVTLIYRGAATGAISPSASQSTTAGMATIHVGDLIKSEGDQGQTTQFLFTVTLSAAYDQAVTMSYRTVDGTAKTSDSDYIAKTGTLTFAPGETTKTITIEVKGDSKKEANETFYLDLFGNSSNSLFTENRGIGTILNDD